MKTCKSWCKTWNTYKYLKKKKPGFWDNVCFGYMHKIKEKIAKTKLCFEAKRAKKAEGQREEDSKVQRDTKVVWRKAHLSCQSKCTATHCLIRALSELCCCCSEPTGVIALKPHFHPKYSEVLVPGTTFQGIERFLWSAVVRICMAA